MRGSQNKELGLTPAVLSSSETESCSSEMSDIVPYTHCCSSLNSPGLSFILTVYKPMFLAPYFVLKSVLGESVTKFGHSVQKML